MEGELGWPQHGHCPPPPGTSLRGLSLAGEMGSIGGPGDKPNPGAIQGVQRGEKWRGGRHKAGEEAKK